MKNNSSFTRRQFIQVVSAAGMALPLNSFISKGQQAVKISVFSKPLQWLDYTLLAQTAVQTGFDGLDLTVRPGGHVLPERVAQDLPKAVKEARKAGLEVTMLTTAITSAKDVHTEPILKTASKLGIKYYRMGWFDYEKSISIEQSLEKYKIQLQELARLNKIYGIHGAYQNHSGARVGGPVWDLWMLLKDIDPQWLGCQYDIYHATVEGGKSWPLGMKLLHKHINTLDIKDFKWVEKDGEWHEEPVPLEEGMVNYKQYFELVKSLSIQAPISLHYEYPLFTEKENTLPLEAKRKIAVDVMKKDLAKLKLQLKQAGLA